MLLLTRGTAVAGHFARIAFLLGRVGARRFAAHFNLLATTGGAAKPERHGSGGCGGANTGAASVDANMSKPSDIPRWVVAPMLRGCLK